MTGEEFGAAMRRIRQQRGVSLRGLGQAAHLDPGHLSKIENGRRPCTIEMAKAVDRALDAAGELVTAARADRARRVHTAVPFEPVRRRTLVFGGLATSAILGLGGARGDADAVGRVGVDDAVRLQCDVDRLHSLDHQHGGASIWQAAAALASEGYHLLENGDYTEVACHQLLRALGRVQMCAGWLAFDAGRYRVAKSCYAEALALAQQADDVEVQARALTNLASYCTAVGRPREALRLVGAAGRVASAPGADSRLPAMPHLRRATASSLMGDSIGADSAIASARVVVDQESDSPAREWSAFLSQAELDGVEGTCAIELGRPIRAALLLEQAISGYGARYVRNRALYRVRLARVRLDLKAPDGAVDALTAALDDLSDDVASWRIYSELDAVGRRLAAYPQVSGVEAILGRLSSLSHGGTDGGRARDDL